MSKDWHAWHAQYDEPSHPLARRLAAVRRRIGDALDSCPPGPIRAISMCAGDGRDLLGALAGHPRARDVRGRLVELDPTLSGTARARAHDMGLDGIDVVTGDASTTSAYDGAVPADLVLACGVFGNITDADIANTIDHLPTLCAARATVIWTRGRTAPDKTPSIRERFRAAGFAELAFDAPDDTLFAVGTNRYDGGPRPYASGVRLFTFVGWDRLAAQ